MAQRAKAFWSNSKHETPKDNEERKEGEIVMARKSVDKRDGIYVRKDRPGFWISWSDAQGRRRYRKTDAQNITQARQIRNAELLRVEQARVLGFSPPGEDSFEAVAKRYLSHQKARVSRESYLRERSV
jgi:hypothetical protein